MEHSKSKTIQTQRIFIDTFLEEDDYSKEMIRITPSVLWEEVWISKDNLLENPRLFSQEVKSVSKELVGKLKQKLSAATEKKIDIEILFKIHGRQYKVLGSIYVDLFYPEDRTLPCQINSFEFWFKGSAFYSPDTQDRDIMLPCYKGLKFLLGKKNTEITSR